MESDTENEGFSKLRNNIYDENSLKYLIREI